MPPWLSQVLTRIHAFARTGKVRLTLKAQRELAVVGLGLDIQDACDVLAGLRPGDSTGRLLSRSTGEWMYVFKPVVAETLVYVKVVLRSDCLVVSFHEDEGAGHEEDA